MRETVGNAIQIVTFIFAAFGGFLSNAAPPQGEARFAVGISSFFTLILFFLISGAAGERFGRKKRNAWRVIAVILFAGAIAATFAYKHYYDDLVFGYPPETEREKLISGADLTKVAADYVASSPPMKKGVLLAKLGGFPAIETVWTKDSVNHAKLVLTALYTAMVVLITATVFALVEGTLKLARRRAGSSKNEQPVQNTIGVSHPADTDPPPEKSQSELP